MTYVGPNPAINGYVRSNGEAVRVVAGAASGGTLKGLVIDLRYNPGGVLGPSVEVANCFIGDDIAEQQ